MGRRAIKDEDQSGDQRAAQDAAEDAADLDRLLKGEDPGTRSLEDAEHWRRVYQELLDFKGDLLNTTHSRVAEMDHDDARREVRDTDQPVLEAERERFAQRLKFWEQRCEEIGRGQRSRGSTSR